MTMTESTRPGLTTLPQIEAAQHLIKGRLHRTPVHTSHTLSKRTGARVVLKLEQFQKTGSFKPRGVLNALSRLGDDARRRGVISMSAGNHAQALAWGASSMDVSSTIVMPATAVRTKVEATRGYGGEVVLTEGDLLDTCLEIGRQRGLTFLHPFDDADVIAGAATLGAELLEDVPDVDCVIAGCGGGGLLSGVAAAMKLVRPRVRVIGVEPVGAMGMIRGLVAGIPIRLESVSTIADGLAAPFVGHMNLAHVRQWVDEMIAVTDDEIASAMRLLMERAKVVVEPAGAAAAAALLSGQVSIAAGSVVAVVVSGGNVDLERLKGLC